MSSSLCDDYPVRVVAAVIRDQESFLACRRAPHKSLAGKWEFPGGKVEASETDEEALEREIFEELGVKITVSDFVLRTSQNQGQSQIEMFTYLASLTAERPTQSSDHDQMRWLSIGELPHHDWAELDIPVIEELLVLFNR